MHRAPLTAIEHDTELVESLRRPAAYMHPVDDVGLIETHISWLLLAGEFAYKLKKPIVLDFLDFGTRERRRFYCEEEIRLNRRWAPEIYIDVMPVTITDGQARFDAPGTLLARRAWRLAALLGGDRTGDRLCMARPPVGGPAGYARRARRLPARREPADAAGNRPEQWFQLQHPVLVDQR